MAKKITKKKTALQEYADSFLPKTLKKAHKEIHRLELENLRLRTILTPAQLSAVYVETLTPRKSSHKRGAPQKYTDDVMKKAIANIEYLKDLREKRTGKRPGDKEAIDIAATAIFGKAQGWRKTQQKKEWTEDFRKKLKYCREETGVYTRKNKKRKNPLNP